MTHEDALMDLIEHHINEMYSEAAEMVAEGER